MVEFAITVPFLLLIVWVTVDFARLYYTSNSLSSAVREGARFAAVQSSPTASLTAIKTKVKDSFNAFGGPAVTDAEINLVDSSAATDGYVTVEVLNYVWTKSTPITFFSGGSTVTLTRRAKFRYERSGT